MGTVGFVDCLVFVKKCVEALWILEEICMELLNYRGIIDSGNGVIANATQKESKRILPC